MQIWKAGDTAFMLVSNRQVREVLVLRASRDFCVVRTSTSGIRPGAIRLRPSRLFRTAEEAQAAVLPHPEPQTVCASPIEIR